MVNISKYPDTEGSDDTEHVAVLTAKCNDEDDDEFVCDSLSETEHAVSNNEHSFCSLSFYPHGSTKGKSPVFTNAPNNGLKGNFSRNSQSFDDQSFLSNACRNKIPLKAIDLDSTCCGNHILQANDRTVTRNNASSVLTGGYASRRETLRCDFDQLDVPADNDSSESQNEDINYAIYTPSIYK